MALYCTLSCGYFFLSMIQYTSPTHASVTQSPTAAPPKKLHASNLLFFAGLGTRDVVWGIVWGIDDVFVDSDVLCDDEVVAGDGDSLDELVCCVVMLGKTVVTFEVIGSVVLLWCPDVVMVTGFDMLVLADTVVSPGVVMVTLSDTVVSIVVTEACVGTLIESAKFWAEDTGAALNLNLLILILFSVRNK